MPSQHKAPNTDLRAIDEIVGAFFQLFSNQGGVRPDLRGIFKLCVPEAVICKCVSATPEISSLEAFIAPREALLSNGTLVDFREAEIAHRTQLFGNIAQRSCMYTKSGVLNGVPFHTLGVKVFQFVRSPQGWRISAVSWDDERDGFNLDPNVREYFGATEL